MASPALFIVPDTPPNPDPWIDQLQEALATALLVESDLTTRMYAHDGGCGLALLRDQAERRVKSLTAQLAEELARVGVSRG